MTPRPVLQARPTRAKNRFTPTKVVETKLDISQSLKLINLVDITVLHSVVTAAQGYTDSAREPKPLPVAALFKAYDEILPEYGLDPDQDQHISPFLFRIGGEQGDASLMDKFQSILSRMGIVLEFGDHTVQSVRSATSSRDNSPLPQASRTSPQPNRATKLDTGLPRQVLIDQAASNAPSEGHSRQVSATESNGTGLGQELKDDGQEPRKFPNAALEPSARNAPMRSEAARISLGAQRFLPAPPHAQTAAESSRGIDRFDHHQYAASQQVYAEPSHGGGGGSVNFAIRPSLFSILDRWQATAGANRKLNGDNAPRAVTGQQTHDEVSQVLSALPPKTSNQTRNPLRLAEGSPVPPTVFTSQPTKAGTTPVEFNKKAADKEEQAHTDTATADEPPKRPYTSGVHSRSATPEQVDARKKDEIIWARAVRARELRLSSKYFNLWADRTARRLEREAVARRHMIRFRCFRGWSHVPLSRTPVIDQMKATSATQKLRRAVHRLEEPLRITAAAALRTYRERTAIRAVSQWSYRVRGSNARQAAATRNQRRAMTRWLLRANDEANVGAALTGHRNRASELNTSLKWHGLSRQDGLRHRAAIQIGDYRSCFEYLGCWWDQAEIGRRAQEFRSILARERARSCFLTWNLSARAQAFQWKVEYTAVDKAFRIWAASSQEDARIGQGADRIARRRRQTRVLELSGPLRLNEDEAIRLQERARLFICATRLMSTFDKTVQRRRAQEKEALKMHLMRRYQQVSKVRKKRNFFRALNHWSSLANHGQKHVAEAKQFDLQRDSARQAAMLDVWFQQAGQDLNQIFIAQNHCTLLVARRWIDTSVAFERRQLESRLMHAGALQSHYQKLWSMSSLQQSGHAHTAAISLQRRNREKRSKALGQWKYRCTNNRTAGNASYPHRTPKFGSSSTLRGARRSLASRRSYPTRFEIAGPLPAPTDTPTRWTGQLVPLQSLLSASSMPRVEEADEQSTISSGLPDFSEQAKSPSRISTALPSTTPKGPVPTHLAADRQLGASSVRRPSFQATTPAARSNSLSKRTVHSVPGRSNMFGLGSGNAFSSRTFGSGPTSALSASAGHPEIRNRSPPKAISFQTQSLGSGSQQQGQGTSAPMFGMPTPGGPRNETA